MESAITGKNVKRAVGTQRRAYRLNRVQSTKTPLGTKSVGVLKGKLEPSKSMNRISGIKNAFLYIFEILHSERHMYSASEMNVAY